MTTLSAEPTTTLEDPCNFAEKFSLETRPSLTPEKPPKRAIRYTQMALLIFVLAAPALLCLRVACVSDPDIWWHLRVGEWIWQHHAVPLVEAYSRQMSGTRWVAYSWLFELLTFKLFQWFGVVGIVAYSTAMVLAITVALRHLIQRLHNDFSLTLLLTFAACFSLGHLYTPRPWLFSILFFVLELDILMQARRTGRLRELAWLPLIFALWANIHIEFIYGLFLLGIAWMESVAARWSKGSDTRVRGHAMGLTLLACGLATLMNPAGWRIYGVVVDLATQGGALNYISEMQAIPFRTITDYCILVLAVASVGALAWRRRFRLFESSLLLFAIVLGFRSQRAAWLISTLAVAILGSTLPERKHKSPPLPNSASMCAAVVAAFLILASFRVMKVNSARLNAKIADALPVRAVEAIRAKGYPGPLYNDFNWGGYLIWALRQPVSIDGRTPVYGDARIGRSITTWAAHPDWASDAQLRSARVVVGPITAPLTQVLRLDSHFQLVYEDKLSAVFVARR